VSTFHKFEVIAIGEIDPDTLSTGIQAWIDENYSHLAILVDDTRVFHATEKGFHESTLEKELVGSVIRKRIEIRFDNDLQRAEALGWLRGKIGAKYSFMQYLGYFFPLINHLKWIKNQRSETVCSEVVGDWLYDCAPDFKFDSRLNQTDFLSPKDVISLLTL
jgi:hypothetical protein